MIAPPYRELGDAPLPDPPARPRLWTLALAVAAVVVATVVGLILSVGLFIAAFAWRIARSGGALPSADQLGAMATAFVMTAPGLLVSGLVSSLVFGGVAALGGVLSPVGARERLRLGATPRWAWTGLAATPVLLGIGMVASQVTVALGLENTGTLPLLRRAFSHLPPVQTAIAVVIIGAGAGFGEELFFRGYLLTRLEQRLRPWIANALVAFAFALAHFDPVHSTFAFLVGVAQGWTARRSGSIRPAILAHTANNVVGVLSMAFASSATESASAVELATGVALAALGLAGVWWLTRPRP